ncbi:hypothetical protein FE394_18020 [Xenorhabdus sp. Reich]|uniref:Uncharacterized protein n=1 Tax=Xenorhabdus littoralis TaxID=2582835 RepID=A0ABU4SQV1_9GAMM|nr:hypothetical protein [Xenorhabdus sp. Reich]MDX8001035.1 hypothetical protein [Xenorhabdus sp. Reich]
MDFLVKNITPTGVYIDGVRHEGLGVELVCSSEELDDYRFVTEIVLLESETLSVNEIKDRVIEIAKEKLKKAVSQI